MEGRENKNLKFTRCTHDYMRTLRRLQWEEAVDWGDDEDRVIDSTEALPEDLQDYSVPVVMVGSDVVNLYPSLEADKVVGEIEQEMLRTDMQFDNIDYLETTRYLVLNWTQEEARRSPLRRVLPWRRGRRGTKPGITGVGPLGKVRGDQEQWEFPQIILEDWEKKAILAAVIRIATETMFRRHYYTFGGKTFHQSGGGPIGLRGTCAVARIVLQIFDMKWGKLLRTLNVEIYGNVRYMDDYHHLDEGGGGWRVG